MTKLEAIELLTIGLLAATDTGVLDDLTALIHPDTINHFCDAVDTELRKRKEALREEQLTLQPAP